MPRLPLPDFLQGPTQAPILDVRAPVEYAQGHIPGAISFPLFSDEERARIGTTYKQMSQEKAVLLGLDFFGPRMSQMVKQAQKLAPHKQVRVHCWRGGMRSGAVLWLLELAGFQVHLLNKGYKDYRHWALAQFAQPRSLVVLGGLTGSGKTDVLQALAAAQQPVLDLEHLATHKGSAFGSIGLPAQPTQEQFENNLAAVLATLHAEVPTWVEDESRTIGSVHVPPPLFAQLHTAPLLTLEIPRQVRVRKLAEEYGRHDPAALAASVLKIRKRLGGLATKEALAAIGEDDMEKMVSLVLDYYDRTYSHGLSERPVVRVVSDTADPLINAELVQRAALKANFLTFSQPIGHGS
ncbi:tRNA 2-selenouridine(34) synthase MnmH [Hymenobacter sp. HSC-4F20]|uniref:tRNA 2-selenouridine(34) synthase MnmH n=1 Tax=Hymenobacter sp. HSC-4F20 TaxID=2864135 RepID=UPI001C72CFDC|nr:tRNA 2-selenouridine(34) synthase MnmH [Hymenobacter sp. HSC-4F20]MBX0292776.1 tRNA 2-selenouridine(34) synthase MnmH [Hymenobacter sp. HSC-4F20]